MKRNLWVLLVILFTQTACKQKIVIERTAVKEHVKIFVVKDESTTLTLKYPATLRGRQDIAIYPQIEGKIVKVCVEEGQTVKRGQPLFVINQIGYRAALATAQANIQAANARVDNALLTLKSKQQLKQQKVVSSFTVEQAANALKTARAELAQAHAEKRNAANNLSYTIVRSPSAGVVGTLPYKIGALVSPQMSQPLTSVSDNARMVAFFSLTESQLTRLIRKYGSKVAALKEMPSVKWEMSDGCIYEMKGRVATISGILDAQTGSVSVRAIFNNDKGLLISGAAGNVLMPMSISGAVVIPQTVVSELQDKMIVYRMVNGKPVMTQIKVYPINDGNNYIVTEGLKAGDKIKL